MKKIIILTAVIFLAFTGLSFAAQKTITTYIRAGNMATYLPTVDPGDFVTNDPAGAMSGSLSNNNLSLGNNKYDSAGSYIYGGDSDIAFCVEGKCVFGIGVRVYFEFKFTTPDTSSGSTAQADGFTFFVINGSNNNKNSTGGSPVVTSMGELLGFGGPGRTDGLGLQPPKIGIEFDTYPNKGTGDVCSSDTRADANNDNHLSLMFWGDNTTGNCTISGNTYPKSTFDDNRHGVGTGTNPVNSSNGDGTGGYYSVAKGSSTYNWLEDNVTHRFRMEITRSSSRVYNIRAWVDCPGCTADQLKTFVDLTVPYDNETLSPKRINRTVTLTAADHDAFNTMLFGFGFATGGATQTIQFQNFAVYFPRSGCGYGTNPASASPSNAAQSGNISVLATAGCAWTATSDQAWLTIPSGGGNGTGTGNGTVIYDVSANTGTERTGHITIGDSITSTVFTVTQAGVPTYTITASAGANGTIAPSGTVTVNQGSSQTFAITPNANYHVANVLVDGTSVGTPTSYTFTNVTANHTISATFAYNTCTLTIADNSFACKSSTASNRIYIKVYLDDGWGNPVTDATVTYKIDSGTSTTLTNNGGGYYGDNRTSTCGALNGSTADCARTGNLSGSHTVSVTATRTGCTGSPLTKTMTVP